MKKLLLFSLLISTALSCSSSKKVNSKREMSRRGSNNQVFNYIKNVNKNKIDVYLHGYSLNETSYFHGGFITIYLNQPKLDFSLEQQEQ